MSSVWRMILLVEWIFVAPGHTEGALIGRGGGLRRVLKIGDAKKVADLREKMDDLYTHSGEETRALIRPLMYSAEEGRTEAVLIEVL